jgi:hypothetical protein
MTSNPRLQQLASEAARKIQAVTEERDADIQRIYREYQQEVAAIRAESTTDGIAEPRRRPL